MVQSCPRCSPCASAVQSKTVSGFLEHLCLEPHGTFKLANSIQNLYTVQFQLQAPWAHVSITLLTVPCDATGLWPPKSSRGNSVTSRGHDMMLQSHPIPLMRAANECGLGQTRMRPQALHPSDSPLRHQQEPQHRHCNRSGKAAAPDQTAARRRSDRCRIPAVEPLQTAGCGRAVPATVHRLTHQ